MRGIEVDGSGQTNLSRRLTEMLNGQVGPPRTELTKRERCYQCRPKDYPEPF